MIETEVQVDRWPIGILKFLDGSGYDHATATVLAVEAKVESKIQSSRKTLELFRSMNMQIQWMNSARIPCESPIQSITHSATDAPDLNSLCL